MSDQTGGGEKGRSFAGMSRRRLLYALSAVGAAGTLTGVGTAAVMLDGERFRSQDLNAGQLVLEATTDGSTEVTELTFEDVAPGLTQRRTVCFTVDTNPAWAWLQICPTRTSRQNLILRMVEAEITFDGLGWETDSLTLEGSLFDVLRTDIGEGHTLLSGIPLTGTETEDLDPGSDNEVCMTVELRLSDVVDETVAEQIQGEEIGLLLQASATQSRHDMTNANPFGPCGGPGTEGDPEGIDISWIAFCVEDGLLTAEDIVTLDAEDPPKLVSWESDLPVDAIVIKAGQEQWYIDAGGATEGTAGPTSADGGVLFFYGNDPEINSRPCVNGAGVKFDYEDGQWIPTEYEAEESSDETEAPTDDGGGGT